jgi:two-component system sensor kinase FixL
VQRRELAHLSRVAVVSTLSGSLAHELSQPLSSILSNAQAGQRFLAMDPPDLQEVRDILAHIVDQDRRAGEVIHRLREMLRRGEVSLQAVDVVEALEELLRLVHSDLLARRVQVVNLAGAELPRAMTDRVQLQQVLLNLVFNACDAMAGLAPAERELTITMDVEQDQLRIGVLDRGPGLPGDIEVLFQPFHTTKEDGLGMGLSICRTLVAAHKGQLWAERRPGGGAAFFVALPLAPAR